MMDIVELGWRGLADVLIESMRAVRARVTGGDGRLNRELVAAYFTYRTLSARHAFDDVVASGSWSYIRLLRSAAPHFLPAVTGTKTKRVIDFGCGDGALVPTLRDLGFKGKYIGHDLNEPLISQLHRRASAGETYSSEAPVEACDALFLVNVLAYTSDNEIPSLLNQVVKLVSRDGVLIVADPWPSWRWETNFDGLQLQLRTIDLIQTMLYHAGMVPISKHLAVVATVGRLNILPFAWLGVWRFSL